MDQLAGILPLILIFVVFYFLLIRPQQKKLKDHKNMISNLIKIKFIMPLLEIMKIYPQKNSHI